MSYELVKKGYSEYTWRDNFSRDTLGILAQHAIQSKMSRVDTALTRFLVYSQVIKVFSSLYSVKEFILIIEKGLISSKKAF